MIEVENILFDFNGTLVDDVDLCLELLNNMLIYRKHDAIDKKQYLEVFGFPVIEYYKKAGFIFPKDDFDELAVYFIEQYSKRNVECPLYEDVVRVLQHFKSLKKKLAIVSASEINLLRKQLKLNNIDTYFDGVSGLDNIHAGGKIESAKRFINEKKYNLDKTVFIGDTLHDGEVAEALGVKCILVARGHQSYERLSLSNHIVVSSLEELIKIIQ